LLALLLGAAGGSVMSGAAQADEKSEKVVTLDKIPAAAREGLLREAAGAPILSVEEESKKGKTLYEAHVKQGKEVLGIVVDADGKLIEKHNETHEKGDKKNTK
jgi:hypothetical protein